MVTKNKPMKPFTHGSLFTDLYSGLEFNPRIGFVDFKVFLYLYGAVVLQLVMLSAIVKQYNDFGRITLGLATHVGLLSFFVVDYVLNEVTCKLSFTKIKSTNQYLQSKYPACSALHLRYIR